jgi:hypothetical protein
MMSGNDLNCTSSSFLTNETKARQMAIMGWTSPLDPEVARMIFIFPFSFRGYNSKRIPCKSIK